MAAFGARMNPPQPHRMPFQAGDHHAFKHTFSPATPSYEPRARLPFLINVPYSAKLGSTGLECNPYGFLAGKFPPTHEEMSKPASQRNSTFHNNQAYGHWGNV